MGILGLGSEILTEYKADASQHKRELQELKNFQSALGEEEGKRAAERNAHLTEWIEKLGKVTLAVVAVKEVSEFLWDGYKDGIKDARLATQAMGVDIEKLKEATKGLITENQLLEIAAKANKSAFHNSQEDIEAAGKAIVALEHRGATAAEAMDAVTKALVEGKTRGLEPYGIVVDKNLKGMEALGEENLTLAQKTEIHNKALEQLKITAGEVSDSQDGVGDSMQRTQVKLSDAWDDLKKDLGTLVEAFQPLIGALASVASLVGGIVHALSTNKWRGARGSDEDNRKAYDNFWTTHGADEGWAAFNNSIVSTDRGLYQSQLAAADKAINDTLLRGEQRANFDKFVGGFAKAFNDQFVDESKIEFDKVDMAKAAEEAARRIALQELKGVTSAGQASIVTGSLSEFSARRAGGVAASTEGVDLGAALGYQGKIQAFRERAGVGEEALTSGQKEMINAADMKQVLQYAQEFLNQKTDTVLGKIFGPVGEFDLYKKGFESLTGAVGTMYEAVVSGSESGIGAFKKFIAAQVAADGKLMMIEAVKEGAYAIGNLAYGNFAGAAAHAQAAAEFAAGAVLAGVVASELGYGGGGSSGGGPAKGGNGGGSGGGGSGGSGQSQTVIVYGDSFSEDTPRSRQIRASKIVAQALGTSGGKFS